MNLKLENKRVLVTGSTSGIGKEIAKAFVKEGANVIINGRQEKAMKQTIRELSQYHEVDSVVADISTSDGVNELVDRVTQIGPIDILINNAALCTSHHFFNTSAKDLKDIFELNVFSMFYLTQAFLPNMIERNFGRVINISSEAALKPYPKLLPYSMTKAAVVNFTKGIAEFVSGYNITANSILPGPTLTNELNHFLTKRAVNTSRDIEDIKLEILKKNNPTSVIQRFVEMEEVAGMALYLSSKQASAITGSAIRVEGGILSTI
ncbi:SDR family oxidoreductase [Cytobacillus sp. IB215316]|uniref:SDR family NAD(P)-dependent oxidoreductase n=1 Tax=Cytobacillus sp. IB215316 TaxID=3097354 RepID=UPI002A0F2C35|nr:SDR family oxidoreductase [Cytobacillus sp. IB215316]MDX8360709.1 SDR family oxidoreductase [Cytobacillus sp. IB215316]